MDKLFKPKSIAIIGASSDKEKIGNILIKNLQENKKLNIFPVNPKGGKIEGLKAYTSILDVEKEVDLALIAVPAKFVPDVVRECAWKAKPVKNIVIISAGFSEMGKKGEKLEAEIRAMAGEYELKIVGPNCLGVLNATEKINASFAKRGLIQGSIGMLMQSGALTTSLLDLAKDEGLGFSSIVTLGNKTVLNEADFLDYFKKDKTTKVVGMYLEDIACGDVFLKKLKELSTVKPVVIIKSGTSKEAKKAIQSHTGAMAGEADVVKAAIRDSGAIFCDNLSDFMNLLKFFSCFKLPQNETVVILTNAGGPGVITTDLIGNVDGKLKLYSFSEKQKDAIKGTLPVASSVNNPIDVLGDANEKRYEEVLKNLAKIEDIGSIIAIITPQSQTPIKEISKVLSEFNKKAKIPVLPIFIGGEAKVIAKNELLKNNLSNFDFPIFGVKSLGFANQYAWLKNSLIEKKGQQEFQVKKARQKESQEYLTGFLKRERSVLLYKETRALAKMYDIPAVKASYINSEKQIESLKTAFPVVAKIDSERIIHKNAKNGLVLGIKDVQELKRAYKKLKKSFPDEEILIQKQTEPGFEIILGIKKDPSFGHILMIGLGGIMTEIFDEKEIFILPKTEKEIARRLKNSKIARILKKQKINPATLIKEAVKVGQLAGENPQIKELDINPLFLFENKEPITVDVKIILETVSNNKL